MGNLHRSYYWTRYELNSDTEMGGADSIHDTD
jgi:hypothetical protein